MSKQLSWFKMKKIVIPFLLSVLLINSAWAVDFSELKFKRQNRERIAVLKKDGQPYTGVATSFFDNGQKKYESYYWQGKKHGPSYTWVKTGELKKELHWLQNNKLGLSISWEKVRGSDSNDRNSKDENTNAEKDQFKKSKLAHFINDELTGLLTTWSKGVKNKTVEYVGGKRHGMETVWAKGKIKSQTHYRDRRVNGLAQEFYPDGSLKEEYTKNNSGYDGLRMAWGSNGLMQSVDFYTDAKSEGVSSRYSDTGILSNEKSYRKGKEFGIHNQYYANGTPYLLFTTHTGKRIRYYKNSNQREYEEYYLKGYRDNNQYRWHSNGKMERISAYSLDKLKGLSTAWYANGFKESEAFYEGYNVNGNMKAWYGNGQLKSDTNYVHGEIDGASFVWYRNGQLKSKTDYKLIKGSWNSYGKKHGDALEWYADGKKKIEARYRNGELTGIRRTWRDDGSLYSERDMSATEQ